MWNELRQYLQATPPGVPGSDVSTTDEVVGIGIVQEHREGSVHEVQKEDTQLHDEDARVRTNHD